MTSFSRQAPFPQAEWILPRPSIHSQTCHFENLSKVTLLWRLKPLFHWAENCYWIWSWIIGSHVPKQPTNKRWSYVLLSHSKQWHSEAERHEWRGYCWTGHCSPLYMSHIKQAVSVQFREDAIYSDLKEGHEWNKKKSLNFKVKMKTFSHVVTFSQFTHTHTHRTERVYP